jgi:uncharacterized membrane protein YdjX (TVP38/TMEM64 family)
LKTASFLKIISYGILILAVFFAQFFFDISSYFKPEQIKSWLASAGPFSPLLYISFMTLAVIISPIPSLPLDIAAGAFFGAFLGTLYSVIGALGGAVVSFLISRFLGRQFIERFLGGHINFCTTCSDRVLTKFVFFSRLLPIFSFDIISYGAGLTKISLKRFSLATLFGMIPITFIYNYFGAVFVFGNELTVLLGLILIIFFFLLPRLLERTGHFFYKSIDLIKWTKGTLHDTLNYITKASPIKLNPS